MKEVTEIKDYNPPRKMRFVKTDNAYLKHTTLNKVYDVIQEKPGLFKDYPYYVYINDKGKKTTCHQYRMEDL